MITDNKKEQERDELHRAIWNMANGAHLSMNIVQRLFK